MNPADLQPAIPLVADAKAAARVLIGYLRGTAVTPKPFALRAAYVLLGYALTLLPEDGQSLPTWDGNSHPEAATALDKFCAAAEGDSVEGRKLLRISRYLVNMLT